MQVDGVFSMNFSSKLLEDAVAEFSKLPGIGQKTALRLVLHLLNKEQEEVDQFGNTLIRLRKTKLDDLIMKKRTAKTNQNYGIALESLNLNFNQIEKIKEMLENV